MIDEFQDTSLKEWENFLPLLQNAMAQSEETSVLIVGDIKQSIYRWRGGDWKILHGEAQQALGASDTQVEVLRENWRSLPAVVAFNNRIIERIVAADNRALNETLAKASEEGSVDPAEAAALRDTLADAYRGHAQLPRRKAEHPGYVSVETFAERPPVASWHLRADRQGIPAVRHYDPRARGHRRREGRRRTARLQTPQRGPALPFRRDDPGGSDRGQRPRQLVHRRGPAAGAQPRRLALARRLQPLPRPPVRPAARRFERDFFRSVRLLSPEEAFERIVMRHALQGDRRQTAYLQAIHEQIISFCATKIADIALFLRWWEETGKNRSLSVEESATTVEITTIHKAKGLEKRAVLIPYCSWSPDPKSSGTVQNIVWAEARGDGAEAIGRFPVRYKKAMAESGFSSEYYRELVYAHVDNVNLLYVALTRAAESLHVFIPQKGGRTVGGLLLQSIATDGDKALLGDFEGRCTIDEAGEHFAFGEFAGPVAGGSKRSEAEHVILEEYPTAQADLRLRLPSQRYFEDGGEVELSPRNLGILMHRAFEQADDEAGIHEAVRGMQADGTLSEADAATLRQMIARALEHPEVREWFGGGWERVRNENEIIIPGRGSTRRPDRVMIDGRRVVVVDYKFGLRDAERHRRQMREYLRLLGEMGYAPAEGYLWYVKLGKIEKVEP